MMSASKGFLTQEYVTFDGMAKVCAAAAGISDPQIVHYDPKSVEVFSNIVRYKC